MPKRKQGDKKTEIGETEIVPARARYQRWGKGSPEELWTCLENVYPGLFPLNYDSPSRMKS